MARTNLHNFLTDDDWSMLVMKVLKMDKMMRLKMITTRMLRMKSKTQPRREEKDPPDPAAEVSLLLLSWSNIYLTWPPPTSTGRQCCTILLWRHCASMLVWRHRASLNQLLQVSSHMASRQDFTSQHLCSCLPDCFHRLDDFIEIRPNLAQFLQ